MLVFHNYYNSFLLIPDGLCIFALIIIINMISEDINQKLYNGFLTGDDKILRLFYEGDFAKVIDNIIDRIFFRDFNIERIKREAFNNVYCYLTGKDPKNKEGDIRLRRYEIEGNGNFLDWLADMIVNYYQNERNKSKKKQQRHHTSSIDDGIKHLSDKPDTTLEEKEVVERIEKALGMMNSDHAEIARSIIEDVYSPKILAIKLGKAEGSISRLKDKSWEEFKNLYFKLREE
jgi:hypothetical protein